MNESVPAPDRPTPKAIPSLKPLGSPVVGPAVGSAEPDAAVTSPVKPLAMAGPGPSVETPPRRRTAYTLPTATQVSRASMLGPVVVLLVCVVLWWRALTALDFEHTWVVDSYPVQLPVEGSAAEPWFVGEIRFEPMAHFEVEALLLRKTRYRLDGGARVSPWDFAVGWGMMSDSEVLAQMRMGHSGRFYRYSVNPEFPLPLDEINRHLANIHTIPANDLVFRLMSRMGQGDRIRLRGRLVNVYFGLWGSWRTSLDRTDTGNGACEILWVEYAEKL